MICPDRQEAVNSKQNAVGTKQWVAQKRQKKDEIPIKRLDPSRLIRFTHPHPLPDSMNREGR